MTRDQKRIAAIRHLIDGIGEADFHQDASRAHEARCGCWRGPSDLDYYKSIARAIDTLRLPESESEGQK